MWIWIRVSLPKQQLTIVVLTLALTLVRLLEIRSLDLQNIQRIFQRILLLEQRHRSRNCFRVSTITRKQKVGQIKTLLPVGKLKMHDLSKLYHPKSVVFLAIRGLTSQPNNKLNSLTKDTLQLKQRKLNLSWRKCKSCHLINNSHIHWQPKALLQETTLLTTDKWQLLQLCTRWGTLPCRWRQILNQGRKVQSRNEWAQK